MQKPAERAKFLCVISKINFLAKFSLSHQELLTYWNKTKRKLRIQLPRKYAENNCENIDCSSQETISGKADLTNKLSTR